MGMLLAGWVLINIYLKLSEKVKYTWVQVFKPILIGYPILLIVGFFFARMILNTLQNI